MATWLMAKRNYEQDVVRLETELAALKSQRQALEHKVSLLDPRPSIPIFWTKKAQTARFHQCEGPRIDQRGGK